MAAFTPAVGFFGKLPAYPDFVRQNAGGPLPRALDNWIHEGVAQMNVQGGDDWKTRFDAAPAKNFLYHTEDPSKFLVGTFIPSRDKSGRRYPFSLFANTTPGKNGQHVHLVAEAYGVFLKAANRLLSNLDSAVTEFQGGKLAGLATTLPQSLYEFDRRLDRFLEIKKMTDFWSETIGDHAGPTKYLVISNLLSTLAPLRAKDVRKFELCLALPLSPHSAAQGLQIAVWLAICRHVLGHPVNSIVAFWDTEKSAEQARLYLFFRPPGPRYLPCLLNPETAGNLIWDMATLRADKVAEAKAQLPPGVISLLDNPELSIGAFLTALTS